MAVDLKKPEGVETVLRLAESADGMYEGFRPGVTERLGIGPDACRARNPRLVYGRMTGWGQDGPMAQRAGHDIDYIALSGALWPIGRSGDKPVPPLNLVGDFGGGGAFLALGMLAGIIEARTSGTGQVVDAAMVDGSSALMGMFYGMRAAGMWTDERGANLVDSGAHFYEVYETSDGSWMAVGAIEPQFYAELLDGLGLTGEELPDQNDRSAWPALKERFANIFRARTREEWSSIFDGTDACAAPVLSLDEAVDHPHAKARDAFRELNGLVQPAPAPRFSRTEVGLERPPPRPGADTDEALADWGFEESEIAKLRDKRAVGGN